MQNGCCIKLDGLGNLYIGDLGNGRVRKVSPDGTITTVAGGGSPGTPNFGDGGPATRAYVELPFALAVDSAGNLFIGGIGPRIRKVDRTGTISTVGEVSVDDGLTIDREGNLFVTDLTTGTNTSPSYVRKLAGVAAPGLLAGAPFPPLPGDVNGDGQVTVADAVLALRMALGTLTPTAAQLTAGDLNGDGKIDVADATAILRQALGL